GCIRKVVKKLASAKALKLNNVVAEAVERTRLHPNGGRLVLPARGLGSGRRLSFALAGAWDLSLGWISAYTVSGGSDLPLRAAPPKHLKRTRQSTPPTGPWSLDQGGAPVDTLNSPFAEPVVARNLGSYGPEGSR